MTTITTSGPALPRRERATLHVGEWQIDDGLNRIARGAERVRLEPKAMAVLMCLVERPMQVVGRDELLAAAWPGVIVGDNALTQVVIKLRKALGDTAREPRYIEAIAKKGYRLVAPVKHVSTTTIAPAPAVPRSAATARGAASGWLVPSVLVAFLVIGIAWSTHPFKAPATAVEMPSAAGAALRNVAPTVLVEPLEVIGPAGSPTLLARAIAADLATDLSKVSGLRVAAGSGAAERPATGDARAAPRYALSGSVQQAGDRLRLNIRLTDVSTDRMLWSERFDRSTRDLFAVQDELVARILAALPIQVTQAETRRLARRDTRNLDAYDRFIRAQAAFGVRRPAQNREARALYWEALDRDPAFARAYAGIALTHALEYQQGWSTEPDATLSRALEFATSSVRLRPDMPEAHWVLAFVDTQRRRHDAALRALEAALHLDPSYADAHALQGGIETYLGRPAQGIAALQRALRLNPDAGSLYFLLLGRAYYFLGDDEQARFQLERALERNPENLEARLYLAASLARRGDTDAARWQVGEIRQLEPRFDADTWLGGYPLTDPRSRELLREAMRALTL